MRLFEQGQIGKLKIKNRIAMAPMGQPADVDGGFTQGNIDYLVARAKGGVGLIITGCTVCGDEFEPRPCNMHNDFHQNDRLGKLADQIHMYGAKLCLQLSPGIGRMNWIDPFTPPYSASPVPNYYTPELICRELPTEGVKSLVKAMGYSAQLAMRAGVDVVEVHAYGGYLIDQFMSAKWNHRTDEYGGCFENRTRFLREIIEEIRKTCGPDYPIAVKLTVDSVGNPHYPGGPERPLEEGIAIAKMLNDMPINLLHVGRGEYSCRWRMVSSVYQPDGFDVEAVAQIKKVMTNVPVMGHGKLYHYGTAEKALESGAMDFVAIGHGMLADPEWANKVKENKWEDIIPCIGCGMCHYNAMNGKILSCAVNPTTGYEKEYALTPAAVDKKILVIGAGPGGMKAAITAAKRGFTQVALWEKSQHMGGRMAMAGAPRFKKDVRDHVEYLIREVYKHNIDVRLGMTATIEDVRKYDPDFVVVSTGADPVVIPVPGHDKSNVLLAEQILTGEKNVGRRAAIIGGGDVGVELGIELSMRGSEVTIIEMLDDVLLQGKHFVANEQNLRYLLEHSGAKVMTGTRMKEILDDGLIAEKNGQDIKIECDNVVFAVGFRANHNLFDSIKAADYDCIEIGDNVEPGMIIDAVHQAYHAIRVL